MKTLLRYSPLVFIAVALVGCDKPAPTIHSIAYFTAHPKEAKSALDECTTNPDFNRDRSDEQTRCRNAAEGRRQNALDIALSTGDECKRHPDICSKYQSALNYQGN
jgi:hypothetical protein